MFTQLVLLPSPGLALVITTTFLSLVESENIKLVRAVLYASEITKGVPFRKTCFLFSSAVSA
jgi:hypothetical protein